jgi:hypothetical protein
MLFCIYLNCDLQCMMYIVFMLYIVDINAGLGA